MVKKALSCYRTALIYGLAGGQKDGKLFNLPCGKLIENGEIVKEDDIKCLMEI